MLPCCWGCTSTALDICEWATASRHMLCCAARRLHPQHSATDMKVCAACCTYVARVCEGGLQGGSSLPSLYPPPCIPTKRLQKAR
jgi:hypothetical protein